MSLSDDLLKHKIFIQRMTTAQAKIMLKAVKQAEKLVGKEINKTTPNYKGLQKKVKSKLTEGIKPSEKALVKFAEYESTFIGNLLVKHGLGSVSVEANKALLDISVSTGLTTKNKSISNTYAAFVNKKSEDIVRSASEAPSEDKHTAVSLIIAGLVTHQLYSLSGTLLNKVSSEVKAEAYKEAGVERVQWDATLDDSVCAYCEDLHGQVFELGDEPECPAHANCRCELVPYGD